MFQDSMIPNTVIYLPLLKRMTALNGPIRVELEAELGEPVEVKAPDGVTAKLEVMLERYALRADQRRTMIDLCIMTDTDIDSSLEAALCDVIEENLAYKGFDLAYKTKYDDGLILRAFSLGAGMPKPQDKPKLLLMLEAWLAHFDMQAERNRAEAVRFKAFGEMNRKREEAQRREKEAEDKRKAELEAQKLAESDLETVRAETTDADLADADAAAFELAWAKLSEAEREAYGGDTRLLEDDARLDVIERAEDRQPDDQQGDQAA